MVRKNDKYGYIRIIRFLFFKINRWVAKPQFETARDFSEGLGAVKVKTSN